ncbi:sugar phosphate isomerase/epimerase family protein [Dyadobacter psychrotolerans]|uniref:Sugar phosphate isomerase/epimerase n=1 Tax=Dyadobacter psychrotolerans TaxID=2541721 RepID=A0A4R5DSF6_9BACT|nr:sugar phosphate isomerase/epimerase family protein [Dyadobacter psychrotolerans]TDE17406.1 sugar phosphate isomerase/epimerase [Dyadobacter psychrotolerans]
MQLRKLMLWCFFMATYGFSALAQNNPENKAGWKLGAQSYTFRLFTFAEALKKIDSCGLKYVEAFPGQTIGGGIEGKMDFKMDAAKRAEVKALLKKYGITITAFGVVKGKDKAEWEQLFAFAKDMGVLNIDTEPDPDQFEYIIPMAEKYKINLALHNHPKPSRYWSPDSVLKYAAKSKFVGSCSDIGHWVRSGLDPVACLKQLEGHVMGMHFKDVVKDTPDGKYHDVIWGKGDSKVDGVIAEMKRQKFKGPISVEYEYHWENNGPEVAESVKYFRSTYLKQK